jgi:predicted nucleotidyltransferase
MNELITKLKEALEGKAEIRLALLFGSYATGKADPNSDIDLAIAYDSKLTMEERIELGQGLSRLLNKEIDLIDLRTASGILLQQIVSNRKTLINRDAKLYGDIIARQITEELDFIPLYEQLLKSKRERFINGQKGRQSKN